MAQPGFIPMPWAENGQKQDPIPAEQTSAGNGRASWKTGFPIENTRPVSNGGVPVNYQDFQGVLHTLSEFACYQQAGGIFSWSDELDYEVGARVLGSDNNVYVAIANSGPASVVKDPVGDTSGKWMTEPNITQASAAALEVASGFVTSGGYTINNGFTVSGGVINGQITSAQYASAIGNTSTNIGAAATPVYVSGGVVTPCGGVAVTSAEQTFGGEKTFTSVISGSVTGNAGTATRLQTARNIQTNLANTSAASFNGTANITPGVTGTLAVANGGTGVTAIADIQAGKDGDGNTITDTYVDKTTYEADMAEKADINGYYSDMTVGNAEQLISDDYTTNDTPYVFRTAGGGVDVGDREFDKLVGGTIVWNQLITDGNFPDDTYWLARSGSTLSIADGVATVTTDEDTTYTAINLKSAKKFTLFKDHRYFVSAVVSSLNGKVVFYPASVTSAGGKQFNGNTTPTRCSWIYTPSSTNANATGQIMFIATNISVDESISGTVSNYVIFDLTQMFGTDIADYLNALDTATPGAAEAWLKKLFPKDFYAYNAGELMSVQAASHDMVGFNAYDNTTGTAVLLGSNQYQITGSYTALAYSTGETITPDSNGLFTPSADGTLTVTGGNATDTCVHLVWSGYRNGEYEPYEKHSYPLDSTLTLRGVPTLDASNNLVYDGDTYASDGTVTRKYGDVDLGAGNWSKISSLTNPNGTVFLLNIDDKSGFSHDVYVTNWFNVIKANLASAVTGADADTLIYYYKSSGSRGVYFVSSTATTNAQLQTQLNGVHLVYQLLANATSTAAPYQSPQIVSDFGTEEYVDAAVAAGTRDVSIPVGHETKYIANLVDKLRRLPDAPDAAGNYLVHYDATTRRASYTAYIGPTELPDAPASDGTYTLKATVADGVVTYSWEA